MAGPDDKDNIRSNKTYRGFSDPVAQGAAESGELSIPPGAGSPHDSVPLVDIEVMHQHGPAPRMDQPAQVVEVWTQNRVYTMDATMCCIRVMDRASGRQDPNHAFLGYRLVGGQHGNGQTFELSYPFPRPGTEAVFEHPSQHRGRFSRTSTVQRVVLRLHVVSVAQQRIVPTWSDITRHETKP